MSLRKFCIENQLDFEHEKYLAFNSNNNLKKWLKNNNHYHCEICDKELKYISKYSHENSHTHNRNLYLRIKNIKKKNI